MRRSGQLKTPYRDGTIHVIFEPLDFMARLAALVPKPKANLTRIARIILILARFAGQPRLSKFIPDEFVTVYLSGCRTIRTVSTVSWSHRRSVARAISVG